MAINYKPRLANYVIEEIKAMLLRGELKEGDKLPNQHEFAQQLGVSRLSLREALHTLQIFGVVEQKPRTGTIITCGDPSAWVSTISPQESMDKRAISELMEARKIMELNLAQLAYERSSEEEKSALGEIVVQMQQAVYEDDVKMYAKLDWRFHKSLALAAKNRYLTDMYLYGAKHMEAFMGQVYTNLPQIAKRSLKYHVDIQQSLAAGDEKKYLRTFKAYMNNIEFLIDKYTPERGF